MRKLLSVLCIAVMMVAGCKSYGDKVSINEKSEVYYTDGASKEEAQQLGNFLLKNNYFDTQNEKSVQLAKNKDTFNVKFVVDKAKVDQQANAEFLFQILGAAISSEVFSNKPVKVILADEYMKGFRDISPYTSGSFSDSANMNGIDSSANNE